MSGERLSQPDEEKERKTLEEILAIPVTSQVERLAKEALLRQDLPSFSNETLLVYIQNKYVYQEIGRRIDNREVFPLAGLLDFAAPLSGASITTRSEKKLFDFVVKGLEVSVPQATQAEVTDTIMAFAHSQLDGNTTLLDILLSYREDMVEIGTAVLDEAGIQGNKMIFEDYVPELIGRAQHLKQIRENARLKKD